MPEEAWRCFVAVPLTDQVRVPLAAAARSWREELEARWTSPEAWHVSLRFLGDVEPRGVERLARSLAEELADVEAFEVTAAGLGAFPSEGAARVLYHGIEDPNARLPPLAEAARRSARSVEGRRADDRLFRPHVTLARFRRPQPLDQWLARWRHNAPTATLPVDEVLLLRSHLGRGPAQYRTLARFPLRVAARAPA